MITQEIINKLRESELVVFWYLKGKGERVLITMKDVIEHYEGRDSNEN